MIHRLSLWMTHIKAPHSSILIEIGVALRESIKVDIVTHQIWLFRYPESPFR
jgi:hypothetical protein